jgi:hypothetical protein
MKPVHAERSANSIKEAIEAGALRFLSSGVLKSVPFEDDYPFQKELYAQVLHQLLMTFLDAEPGRYALQLVSPCVHDRLEYPAQHTCSRDLRLL